MIYVMSEEDTPVPIISILVDSGAVSSKREAVRLLEAGAIELFPWYAPVRQQDEKWTDLCLAMTVDASPMEIRVGKRRFITVMPPIDRAVTDG